VKVIEQGRLTFNDSVSDVSILAASPLSDYLIFEDRLNKITRDVLQTKMIPAWVRYMAARTEDEWIEAMIGQGQSGSRAGIIGP
jgi:hypothetical protein